MSTPIKRAGKFFVLRLLSYVADGKEFIHSLKKWNTEFVSFKFGGKHSTQKLLLLALEGRKKIRVSNFIFYNSKNLLEN